MENSQKRPNMMLSGTMASLSWILHRNGPRSSTVSIVCKCSMAIRFHSSISPAHFAAFSIHTSLTGILDDMRMYAMGQKNEHWSDRNFCLDCNWTRWKKSSPKVARTNEYCPAWLEIIVVIASKTRNTSKMV